MKRVANIYQVCDESLQQLDHGRYLDFQAFLKSSGLITKTLPMTSMQLTLQRISKEIRHHYVEGDTRIAGIAFSDLKMDIKSGQWTAPLGPSGAGKSTILKLIAGMIKSQF